jgi:hypothetical protein
MTITPLTVRNNEKKEIAILKKTMKMWEINKKK